MKMKEGSQIGTDMRQIQDLLDVVKERGISENADYLVTSVEGHHRFSVIGHLLVLLGFSPIELLQLKGNVSTMLTNPRNKYEVKAIWMLLEAGYSILNLRQLERSGEKGDESLLRDISVLIADFMNINSMKANEYGLIIRKLVQRRRKGIPDDMMTAPESVDFPVDIILDSTGRSAENLRSDVDFVLKNGIIEDPEDRLVCMGSLG